MWLQEGHWWQNEETDITNGNQRAQYSKENRGEHQGQGTLVSDHTIRRRLHQSGRNGGRPRRTSLLKASHKKGETEICQNACWPATKLLGECPLDRWDKTGAFWQRIGHISSMFTDAKNEAHKEKNTSVKRGGGATIFRAALSHLAQGALNLCRAQWNLKTVSAFWGEMCSPVSDSWVSVAGHGSSNRIMTQNTELGTTKNG